MKSALFNPDDTVIVLLDHQTGLFQTVKDISLAELRANTRVLAKLGELADLEGRQGFVRKTAESAVSF